MIVDAHAHVWRAMPEYPHPAVTTVSPVSDVPLELLRQYMDEQGIDRAVLVQPLYPGEDNRYVAQCAASEPHRWAAVCVVGPCHKQASERLTLWARDHGCRGLRLRPRLPEEETSFGDPATYPLWETIRELGVVVNLLAGPEHLPRVALLASRFPEIPLVIDHLAHPRIAEGLQSPGCQALLGLACYPNVHIKLSGFPYFSHEPYPYRDCREIVRAVYEHFGAGRLIWGSDFPHVLLQSGYHRSLNLPEQLLDGVPPGELRQITGHNACALYWNVAATPLDPRHHTPDWHGI